MIYESRLSVDLQEWSFEISLTRDGEAARTVAREIPDHRILRDYVMGRRRLSVMVGDDKVFLPRELWQALLGEIVNCQTVLRRQHERYRAGCEN